MSNKESHKLEASHHTRRSYGIAFCVSFVFLSLRIFHWPLIPFAVNGDETLFFARSLRLLHGQALYRDVFELVTPGTELLYALGFAIFGVHGWAIAACHMILGILLGLAITSIARKTLTGLTVFLPLLLFLVFDLSSATDATHHWWSTLCVLVAVAILLRGEEAWRIATCGVFCGMAILFTQTQGTLALAAIAASIAIDSRYAFKRRMRKLIFLIVPCVCLCVMVLGYYCFVAGFHRLYFDLVVFPVTGLSGPMNSPRAYLHLLPPIHGAADVVRLIPFLVILVSVPYCYFVSLFQVSRKSEDKDMDYRRRMILINFVGIALFVAISSGPRFFRICTVAPLGLVVLSSLLQGGGRTRRYLRTLAWSTACVFMVWLPIHRQLQWYRPLTLPTGTVAFHDPGQWQEYRWLLEHTTPGDTMFNEAGAILYLGLRNPMHTELVNKDDFTSEQDVRLILARMKTDPPRYIAFDPDIPDSSRDHAQPFRDYLHTHYQLEQSFLIGTNKYREEIWHSR